MKALIMALGFLYPFLGQTIEIQHEGKVDSYNLKKEDFKCVEPGKCYVPLAHRYEDIIFNLKHKKYDDTHKDPYYTIGTAELGSGLDDKPDCRMLVKVVKTSNYYAGTTLLLRIQEKSQPAQPNNVIINRCFDKLQKLRYFVKAEEVEIANPDDPGVGNPFNEGGPGYCVCRQCDLIKLYGDINKDGYISIADLYTEPEGIQSILRKNYVPGEGDELPVPLAKVDLNCDKKKNQLDIDILKNLLARENNQIPGESNAGEGHGDEDEIGVPSGINNEEPVTVKKDIGGSTPPVILGVDLCRLSYAQAVEAVTGSSVALRDNPATPSNPPNNPSDLPSFLQSAEAFEAAKDENCFHKRVEVSSIECSEDGVDVRNVKFVKDPDRPKKWFYLADDVSNPGESGNESDPAPHEGEGEENEEPIR